MIRDLALIATMLLLAPAARADEPSTKDKAPPKPEPAAVLMDVTLKGSIGEEPSPTGLDGAPIRDNLKGLIDRIAKAKGDKEVKGLVVRLRDLKVGWAKSFELRRAIEDFRRSGKKAIAVLELAENADYLVATAADEIVMPEGGWLLLKGLAAEVTFYKKAFDKLGLKADMLQMGEYKGAGEPFTRTEMSPAFREELTAILQDDYDQIVDAISKRQGIARDEAKKLIDGGPYTPHSAKAAGLVNRIAYPDQLEAEIAKGLGLKSVRLDSKYGKPKSEMADLSGFAGFMKMLQMLSGEGTRKAESKKPKVALIYATGLIRAGKSSSGSLMSDAAMGSDSVIKDLRDAEKDPTVKAIVLRVDSRGGSALASDLIWREVVRIEKPIVASMSDYAASGGYYISMGADKVFAEPGTITGSIGVVGGKIAVGGLLDKLGVTTDTVTVGKNATFMSMSRPWTDDERSAMKHLMEETYKQFVSKAAEGRKMKYDDLEKLARGRVYTGRRAKELGLVDEVGTLDDALAAARSLGGLEDDAELLVLPKPKALFESLLDPLEDRDVETRALAALLPEPARRALGRLAGVARLLESEPAALLGPCDIEIR